MAAARADAAYWPEEEMLPNVEDAAAVALFVRITGFETIEVDRRWARAVGRERGEFLQKNMGKWRIQPGLTEFDEDLKLRGEEELNLFLTPPRLDDGSLRSCSDCR